MNGQVEFLGQEHGVVRVVRIEGTISLIERDGRVVEVVVEDVDGGATFIKAANVLSWKAI